MIEMIVVHEAGRRDGSVVAAEAAVVAEAVAEAAAEAAAEEAEVVSVVVAEAAAAEVVSAARHAGEGRAVGVRGVAGRATFAAMALRSLTTRTLTSCGITWMIARRSSGIAKAARARSTSADSGLPSNERAQWRCCRTRRNTRAHGKRPAIAAAR